MRYRNEKTSFQRSSIMSKELRLERKEKEKERELERLGGQCFPPSSQG